MIKISEWWKVKIIVELVNPTYVTTQKLHKVELKLNYLPKFARKKRVSKS